MTFSSSFVCTSSSVGDEADYCIIIINQPTSFLFLCKIHNIIQSTGCLNVLNKLLLSSSSFRLKKFNRSQSKKLMSSNLMIFICEYSCFYLMCLINSSDGTI